MSHDQEPGTAREGGAGLPASVPATGRGEATPGEERTVRLRIDLAYDGTGFSGWATQPGLRTVEDELSSALRTVLRVPRARLSTAGRTDAGVHARGAVCHTDVAVTGWRAVPGRGDRSPEDSAVARLNGVLPRDVVVRSVVQAPPGFDARFSALRRRYRYRLCDLPSGLDPLRRADTVVVRERLDVEAMDAAAGRMVGLRDFAAFCKLRDGATSVRTLEEYSWRRAEDGVLEATVVADAFCHSMVRFLVGAVVPVGEGRRDGGWPLEVLSSRRRDPAIVVMPPHGLSLEEVVYPADDELAARANATRAVRSPLEED